MAKGKDFAPKNDLIIYGTIYGIYSTRTNNFAIL